MLQYRFGLGLGAKFVIPYLWRDDGNRRYIIELTAMRKVQKRVIDAKDDAKRPAFGLDDRPGIFWKFEYERETKALDLMEADRYGVTAKEVKAFEAELKSEAAEIAAKAAKRKTKFERKRQFPKRFYKAEIARIKRAINICPRELVKEAEARFRKTLANC